MDLGGFSDTRSTLAARPTGRCATDGHMMSFATEGEQRAGVMRSASRYLLRIRAGLAEGAMAWQGAVGAIKRKFTAGTP